MLNTLLRSMDDLEPRMNAITRGWLLGRRAKPMFGVDWKGQLSRPLEDLRRELNLDLDTVDTEVWKSHGEPLAAAA